MPTFRLIMCFITALAAAGCSSSNPEADPGLSDNASQAASSTPDEADPDRVVCKEVRQTGTRFNTRQCLKLSQWEAIQRGARDGLGETQRRASQQQDMPGQGG